MFYGRGRAMSGGRGMGRGMGAGMGFGFRGMTPPWPYVGRGRGGLPRCGYFLGSGSYSQSSYTVPGPASGYVQTGTSGGDEELNYLKYQSEVMKKQLEQIESRMRDLEAD
jgi:hypothetical protein